MEEYKASCNKINAKRIGYGCKKCVFGREAIKLESIVKKKPNWEAYFNKVDVVCLASYS